MGIDYYTCDKCGEAFPDCCDYACCDGCGSLFCDECMDCCDEPDEETDEILSCAICRKEHVTDSGLVEFLLTLAGLTREQAVEKYRETPTT